MIRKIAWDTFKKTGDINTFLEYRQIIDTENKIYNNKVQEDIKTIDQKAGQNGNCKNEWNNNF